MSKITSWLLEKSERGNPTTVLDESHPGNQAWSSGNTVRPLIHGSTYFRELYERIEATQAGDTIYFTDWRGDAEQRMIDAPGAEVEQVLARAAKRGVDVRGLIWRSHWDKLAFSAEENRHLGEDLQKAGAEVLLDMRVRTGGSHHQKFVVIRHREHPERDIAYVGGIDLCNSRRDDADHGGDPQPQSMAEEFGDTPPWHDVQLAIQGPAVHDVETVFRERWEDPTPLTRHPIYRLQDKLAGDDTTPDPLSARPPIPEPLPDGKHTVQLLRTYPNLRHGRDYPFARGGERSVAKGYSKALSKAKHLVYIEDQYLWSDDVAEQFVGALQDNPDLHVIAVLPRVPDQSKPLSRIPQQFGRVQALQMMRKAGGERVAAYGLENHAGTPIYVHAKVCIMDDWWASVGSDNFNRRSWTHDSELSAVVIDDEGDDYSAYARQLRLRLAAEHLDRITDHDVDNEQLLSQMSDCVDASGMFAAYAEAAARLDRWYAEGQVGPRPPGRLRRIEDPHFSPFTKVWAHAMYSLMHDPDGRPAPLRKQKKF